MYAEWDTYGKFTGQYMYGFDGVTISNPAAFQPPKTEQKTKQNKKRPNYHSRIYAFFAGFYVCRKWFSRQQISYYMAIRATSSLLAW